MTIQDLETVACAESPMLETARRLIASDECEVPVLPEVSVQLLKLTADVDCEPADIVALFKRDQSLTAHLLKIANSARYTSGQTVTSIQQAVARLGLLRVREIVFVISCKSRVFNVQGFEDEVRVSFRKSLAAAAFSQEIARVRRLNVEDAFLCGLLHDVGRPVLLQSLLDCRGRGDVSGSDEELRDAAGELRISMAGRLILSWDLPERISETIEHQLEPQKASNLEKQAAILNLAIGLADAVLHSNEQLSTDFAHPMLGVLNLYPEEFAKICDQQATVLDWVRSTV